MTKAIGRQINVGLALETIRGTAVNPQIWIADQSYKFDDKVQKVVDDSSVGVIEDSIGSDLVQQFAEGEIGGRLDEKVLAYFFKLLFGSNSSNALVETGVFDNAFDVLQSAQHPTFTLGIKDPNSGNGLLYSLGSLQEFEINSEINKYCEYKAKFRSNSKTTAATNLVPAYSDVDNRKVFLPQNATLKLADNLAGLSGAVAIEVKKVNIQFKKNIEDDQILGNIQAVDRLNKQFVVEGSFEMITNDNSYRDLLLNNSTKYCEFKAIANNVTIGATSKPTMTLTFYKIQFDDVANKNDSNDYNRHTVKFKAYYSLADSKMIRGIVRSTLATV
jgi:hypothetical protein